MRNKDHLTMLENGLDFIVESIEYLMKLKCSKNKLKRNKNLKYGLLNLSSGIELILKYRLYRENWVYIVSDIKKVSIQRFIEGDFISVNLKEIFERLKDLCDVNIIGNKNIKEHVFTKLRNDRNKFEHFTIKEEQIENIEKNIYESILEICTFISKHYDLFSSSRYMDLEDFEENGNTKSKFTKNEIKLFEKIIKSINRLSNSMENGNEFKEPLEKTNETLVKSIATTNACLNDLIHCHECEKNFLRCAYIHVEDYNDGSDFSGNCYCFFCCKQQKIEHIFQDYCKKMNISDNEISKCCDCKKDFFIKTKQIEQCLNCGNTQYSD